MNEQTDHSVTMALSELAAGELRRVEVAGRAVCVANVEGVIYAVSDECTHARISLSQGSIEGRQVICPWHGAMFDLKTGRAICGPASDSLRVYRTRIENENIIIEPPSDGANVECDP